MADDWRKSMGFSDRLAATSKIASAYKIANAECSSAEASKLAKLSEETARKNATSLEDYNERCEKEAYILLNSAPTSYIADHPIDERISSNLPTTGLRIGRYINAQHYKNGISSEVFRAADPSAPKPAVVALKMTTPEMMVPPHDVHREARILAAAKGPNIISLIETFQQAGGKLILVFPFMPYELGTLLQSSNKLTSQARRTILQDLFAALAHLHALGIIHRDIKPSNILLSSPSGRAYLADFGIAWSRSDVASEASDKKILDVGTTCYRPPELLFGHQGYREKLDMWAAGCVAAQVVCLDGKTLFDAGDLGSELALIKSIFETLGTPDLRSWPEAANMPDWGKMNFAQYPAKPWRDILPGAGDEAVDLVRSVVSFESARRLGAKEVLDHPYLC